MNVERASVLKGVDVGALSHPNVDARRMAIVKLDCRDAAAFELI
jgi:hypothetical protein